MMNNPESSNTASIQRESLPGKTERRRARNASIFEGKLVKAAIGQSFSMLNPVVMAKNPVMFITEVGAVLTTLITIYDASTGKGGLIYNFAVLLVLWLTVLFSNFAESLAEARGKAQADSLKRTRQSTIANRLRDGKVTQVNSDDLQEGDLVVVSVGELIPGDGEVAEGVAMVDESAITGESAPVVREAGGDRSGVVGGTRVISDRIVVKITVSAGNSFLDRMIALVEGAVRQKTPNELALTVTLAGLTLAFLMVTGTLWPIGRYFGINLSVPTLVALLVCLIPTTIGALLSAIGLAGMDRALSANVLAKSGKAVELAGDIDTLLLDKTGTITMGNRQATSFIPLNGVEGRELARVAMESSFGDQTPEGRSILTLGENILGSDAPAEPAGADVIHFSAQTRLSGLDLPDGRTLRKGSGDAVQKYIVDKGGTIPGELQEIVDVVARKGMTPLVVTDGIRTLGVVELSDVLKPGITDRFRRLRSMGLRVVMVTGDNPLTAGEIARQSGVDDYIAEAKPEDKLEYIRREQQSGRLVAMMGDGTNDAPALAQADIGVAMNSGTQAAKEAGNMVDLDSDPTKLIEIIEIGKQLLMTRGALTTFSIANDIAKYFAIIPAMFLLAIPGLRMLNIMGLATPESAILSALIFNAIIIPMLIPIAIRGVTYRPLGAEALLRNNLLVYGVGGVLVPFAGIKLIDMILSITGYF
ncbi:potassium-transporting ATPase subunit KdpB [Chlorobium ferrooxidans]|uniref:Potassium-transporting ATPase ATP-binding subunit n=1 Tax=Chlorobium ferrooxidans DSM 13031 TaxID=377431 RepID=Q0YPF2_9CHLB|nr:potassium-transporting ATPase subunit KdpB [Chlorobium ferrooxidans]EAT58177.1 ATPase, E1-E2 type:Potassium-translocating P-type ATPase, B subunit [Chlorobium ferrooxidans DSM 13031]